MKFLVIPILLQCKSVRVPNSNEHHDCNVEEDKRYELVPVVELLKCSPSSIDDCLHTLHLENARVAGLKRQVLNE